MIETTTEMQQVLKVLGIKPVNSGASTGAEFLNTKGEVISSFSPVDGQLIATVNSATAADYEIVIQKAQAAFVFVSFQESSKAIPRIRDAPSKIRRNPPPDSFSGGSTGPTASAFTRSYRPPCL